MTTTENLIVTIPPFIAEEATFAPKVPSLVPEEAGLPIPAFAALFPTVFAGGEFRPADFLTPRAAFRLEWALNSATFTLHQNFDASTLGALLPEAVRPTYAQWCPHMREAFYRELCSRAAAMTTLLHAGATPLPTCTAEYFVLEMACCATATFDAMVEISAHPDYEALPDFGDLDFVGADDIRSAEDEFHGLFDDDAFMPFIGHLSHEVAALHDVEHLHLSGWFDPEVDGLCLEAWLEH